jgi:hypothetical protein
VSEDVETGLCDAADGFGVTGEIGSEGFDEDVRSSASVEGSATRTENKEEKSALRLCPPDRLSDMKGTTVGEVWRGLRSTTENERKNE